MSHSWRMRARRWRGGCFGEGSSRSSRWEGTKGRARRRLLRRRDRATWAAMRCGSSTVDEGESQPSMPSRRRETAKLTLSRNVENSMGPCGLGLIDEGDSATEVASESGE